MSNFIHMLVSNAGENEAGGTFREEFILYDEKTAEKKFTKMIDACNQFIKSQIDIINSVDDMREHNLSAYGSVGGGYFYDVYWLEFPATTSVKHTVGNLIALYLCNDEDGNERPDISAYVRDYSGHQDRSEAIDELFNMFCD